MPVRRETKSEIAIVCMQRKLNLRQLRGLEYANELFALVEVAIDLFDLRSRCGLLKLYVNRRKNSARYRQQMRRERDFARAQMQLFGNFSEMAMREYAVSREIVGNGNEMRARCRFFSCARDAGLRICDDSLVAIGEAGQQQRCETENYRSRVATRIRDDHCIRNFVAVQFGQTVHGFFGQVGGSNQVLIFESVDRAMLLLLQPPCTAEIYHPDSLLDSFRNQRA